VRSRGAPPFLAVGLRVMPDRFAGGGGTVTGLCYGQTGYLLKDSKPSPNPAKQSCVNQYLRVQTADSERDGTSPSATPSYRCQGEAKAFKALSDRAYYLPW